MTALLASVISTIVELARASLYKGALALLALMVPKYYNLVGVYNDLRQFSITRVFLEGCTSLMLFKGLLFCFDVFTMVGLPIVIFV